jgi:hypothetical protein
MKRAARSWDRSPDFPEGIFSDVVERDHDGDARAQWFPFDREQL